MRDRSSLIVLMRFDILSGKVETGQVGRSAGYASTDETNGGDHEYHCSEATR